MGVEIERKFLVIGQGWQGQGSVAHIHQGYLCSGGGCTVRVRLTDGAGTLTLKGPTQGLRRAEFEYAIPPEDAEALLLMAGSRVVEKHRHTLQYAGHTWEVDVFAGANAGLIVAEIELAAEDEPFDRPPWLGEEVSHVGRYTNAALSTHPFSVW